MTDLLKSNGWRQPKRLRHSNPPKLVCISSAALGLASVGHDAAWWVDDSIPNTSVGCRHRVGGFFIYQSGEHEFRPHQMSSGAD